MRRSRGWAVLHKTLPPIAFIALQVCAQPAWAALGETLHLWAREAHALASARVQAAETYTLHELVSTIGTKIHEYLGHDGKVFAVSWQGPFRQSAALLGLLPDLPERSTFSHRTRTNQHSGTGLVINMSGHQRAFYGRAYIPERVPQGLSTDDIR